MSAIIYFCIGLFVGYLWWKKFPDETPTRAQELSLLVEKLVNLLANTKDTSCKTMLQVTREAVSQGCDLQSLLDHYQSLDPEFQSMQPKQVYRYGDMNIRYLYDYLPARRQQLEVEQRIGRMLYEFKSGNIHRDLMMECVELLKQHGLDRCRYLFICLPASTEFKNRRRYQLFSDFISMKMGWENGFGIITPIDHESQHYTGVRKELNEQNFHIQYEKLVGKRIVLFDDVFTTGNTLLSLSGIIRRAGGYPEEALFLCRTLACKQTVYS